MWKRLKTKLPEGLPALRTSRSWGLVALLLLLGGGEAAAKTLRFSGYSFEVNGSGTYGPGPNHWDPRNAWVDERGRLHLLFTKRGGKWTAVGMATTQRLGYGTYQFQVDTNISRLDRNLVLGLFSYPTADVGADGTNEIDIEISRWGEAGADLLDYTVWPVRKGLGSTNRVFPAGGVNGPSTHRFTWTAAGVTFQALRGRQEVGERNGLFRVWRYAPADAVQRVSRQPMPLCINLWAMNGLPTSDGQEQEVVISSFTFTPER